jgi:predicted nucleic acid-binding protein
MTLVLDASVASRWLSKDGSDSDIAYANAILERLISPSERAYVPCHWSLEIANVALRGERMGYIEGNMVELFLELLEDINFQIDLEASTRALTDLSDTARLYHLTPYDAAYLELAIRLALPLATLDKDLRRAAEKAGIALA